jgi:hypothetical protein
MLIDRRISTILEKKKGLFVRYVCSFINMSLTAILIVLLLHHKGAVKKFRTSTCHAIRHLPFIHPFPSGSIYLLGTLLLPPFRLS